MIHPYEKRHTMKLFIAVCVVIVAFAVLAPACGSSENGWESQTPAQTPAHTPDYPSKLSHKQAKALVEQYVEVQVKAVSCADGKSIMDTLSELLTFEKTSQGPGWNEHTWHIGTNIGLFDVSDDSFAVVPSVDAQEMIAMWLELAHAWCARLG